jgi:hypothetical protein
VAATANTVTISIASLAGPGEGPLRGSSARKRPLSTLRFPEPGSYALMLAGQAQWASWDGAASESDRDRDRDGLRSDRRRANFTGMPHKLAVAGRPHAGTLRGLFWHDNSLQVAPALALGRLGCAAQGVQRVAAAGSLEAKRTVPRPALPDCRKRSRLFAQYLSQIPRP